MNLRIIRARGPLIALVAIALAGACTRDDEGPSLTTIERSPDATSVLVATADRIADAITRGRGSFERIERPLDGLSSEGGEAALFLNAGTLRHAEVTLFGEVGRVELAFYFDPQQRPILVERNTIEYDQPFGDVILRTNERIYVTNDRIAHWIVDGSAQAGVAESDRTDTEAALRAIVSELSRATAQR
jgi:hypothetical protein